MKTFYNISSKDYEVEKRLKKGQNKKVILNWLKKEFPIFTDIILSNHINSIENKIHLKRQYIKTHIERQLEALKKENQDNIPNSKKNNSEKISQALRGAK